MKLTHEYNEYVVGYIVTDEEKEKSVNFQLEKINSNHPSPDYEFTHSCQGDETADDWTEEELEEAQNYIDSQKDVNNLLEIINEAKNENKDMFEELFSNISCKGEVYESDFYEILEKVKGE